MAEPLLILADDLTGAGDSAARCRTAGLPAVVSLHPPPYDRQLAAGAVAFSSDSRHLPPALAAERVGAVVRPYAAMRAHWYKKIDSTLRGNLGSEIDALLDTLGRSRMLICPAFPAQQRTLHNGILLVGTTAFPERHLPTMLAHQSRRRVAHLPLQLVRSDNFAAALMAPDAELLVADALSDADLAGMVAAAAGQPALLLCGSAGLVSALAEQLVQSSAVPGGTWQIPAGPVLLAIGSGSSTAHRQLAYLAAARERHAILMHMPPPTPDILLDSQQARMHAAAFAADVIAAIEQYQPACLVLSGGDTAQSVLARLGVVQLEILAELLPGAPLARGRDAGGRMRYVVLKPGSQGNDDALLTIIRALRRIS